MNFFLGLILAANFSELKIEKPTYETEIYHQMLG